MRGLPVLSCLLISFIAIPVVSRADTIVPAGTLISCTVSETNFSSKTAEVGDPVLCYAGPVGALGRVVLPYGTYLVGRFQDYRDPGHFVGKGWMQLTFDRMVSGPDRVIPISAKVVHVPGLKVDAKGRIVGSGHAVRDSVEWLIPVLWPEKVLTLPMRGPRPRLKQETRMTLKIMDDTLIPSEVSTRSAAPAPGFRPGSASRRPLTAGPTVRTEPFANRVDWLQSTAGVTAAGVIPADRPQQPPPVSNVQAPPPAKDLTMLILKDGAAYLASEYWLEGSARLRYISADGVSGDIPIENLDLPMTVATNQRRGVRFTIRSEKGPRPQ